MSIYNLFHLERVDIFSPSYDNIFDSPADRTISFLIYHTNISEIQYMF